MGYSLIVSKALSVELLLFKLAGVVALAAHFVFLRIAYDDDKSWFTLIFLMPPMGWVYAFRSGSDATRVPAVCSMLAVSSFTAYALMFSGASADEQEWEQEVKVVADAVRIYYERHHKLPKTSMEMVGWQGDLKKMEALDMYGNAYDIREVEAGFTVSLSRRTSPAITRARTFSLEKK